MVLLARIIGEQAKKHTRLQVKLFNYLISRNVHGYIHLQTVGCLVSFSLISKAQKPCRRKTGLGYQEISYFLSKSPRRTQSVKTFSRCEQALANGFLKKRQDICSAQVNNFFLSIFVTRLVNHLAAVRQSMCTHTHVYVNFRPPFD